MLKFWRKLLFQFRRSRFDRELAEEIRLHKELREQQLRRDGLSDKGASEAAARRFGNTTRIRELSRDTWSWQWIEDLTQDLRYAFRILAKSPGFTLTPGLMIPIAIGASTAVFTVFDGTLLRPPAYRDPQRLVVIWDRMPRGNVEDPVFESYADFDEFRRSAKGFINISAATWAWGGGGSWFDGKFARALLSVPVTDTFFQTLGVDAALGRTFTASDEKLPCAVVLSHVFWHEKLAGSGPTAGVCRDCGDHASGTQGRCGRSGSYATERVEEIAA